MIQIQILPLKHTPTILTGVFVALEDVVPGEFHFLFGQPVKRQQKNHLGNPYLERDRANAVCLRLLLGNIMPLVERISLKTPVCAIQHHLGVPLKQQRESASSGADIHCLPQPVENQHMLVERGIHIPANRPRKLYNVRHAVNAGDSLSLWRGIF